MSFLKNFDLSTILTFVDPKYHAYFKKIAIFDVIDSTNRYLVEKAQQAPTGITVCIADQQTQGKGQWGRSWVSPGGENIYCSLLWHCKKNVDYAKTSLLVGIIIAQVLKSY